MKNLIMKMLDLYKQPKYKSIVNYIFFGVCTTLVNVVTYFILYYYGMGVRPANLISITLSILFAYFVNARYVFNSKAVGFKKVFYELAKFFTARLSTLVIEVFGVEFFIYLGMNDVVISNNGSLIRNLTTGEIVYQKSFKIEEVETIFNMFKELNDDSIEFHVYTLNYIYCDRLSFSMARMKRIEKDMPEELKTPMYIHEDIIGEIKKNNESCQKIMMIAKDHDKIEKFYKEVANVLPVDGTFSATDFFDIMPKGCNKGTAIQKLAEHYNIPIEECVVFGDNFNDKEMFDVAGWSVCPNNSSQAIQDMCDEVIGNNNDFSVIEYVEKYYEKIK